MKPNDAIRKSLKALQKQHGLKNIAFCADFKKKGMTKFIGIYGTGDMIGPAEAAEIILNVARLYQAGREKLFTMLENPILSKQERRRDES